MKHPFKHLFVLLMLTANAAQADRVFGKTFFSQRSQGVNFPRWMAGQAHHLYLCDTDCINGSLAITPYYSQTFNEKELGEWFFFNRTNTMRFGPANASGVDVFARNFFLNDDFDGAVTANPISRNFIVDLNFYLGLDEWVCGLYFRVDIPINWTSWDMRLTQTITTKGTEIAANKLGNMNAGAAPNNDIIQAWVGQALDTNTFPDLRQEMRFARIDGKQTKAGVADITFILGYNFICNECSYLGANLVLFAPTGTRPDGAFVFEPVIGNGRHVALGAGINGHYELWNNGCDQSFGLFVEGNAYHLFRAKQKRTFDLKENGVGSRYLLFKRFEDNEYANEILFGPNVLTRDIKVRNDIQGEGCFMFDYQNGGFTVDTGYNIWGRTRDHITVVETIPANTFGVAGNTTTQDGVMNRNTTQSMSTIKGLFAPGNQNGTNGDQTFIRTEDLDVESAEHPGAISHTLFAHLGYTWENCDYLPFLGVGGLAEFSGRENRAFDIWAVWVKGGFTFS